MLMETPTPTTDQHAGHTGGVIWLTGLPGSGKSTLARELDQRLRAQGFASRLLDADALRHGLNADLGYTPAERSENARRIGEVAALFAQAGFICIVACIAPYRADRARARAALGTPGFHEVYLAAELAACEARDPKGLYRKARAGSLPAFTGIDAPYETPTQPDLTLDTGREALPLSLARLHEHVRRNFPLTLTP